MKSLHQFCVVSPSLLRRYRFHRPQHCRVIPLDCLKLRRYSSRVYPSSIKGNGMPSSQQLSITFLTDVEGDGAYFDRFIKHSKLLAFRSIAPSYGRYSNQPNAGSNANGKSWNLGEWDEDYFPYDREVVFIDDKVESSKNSMLVYGGDVWDKGGADFYVLRQLLSLHRRYPNRVHFLMGNRDINKMRIVDELGDGNFTDHALPKHDGVYWLRGNVCSGLPADPESLVPSSTVAERLKWMLRRTMGSVDAFELRRNELKRERFAIMNETSVSLSDHDTSIDGENAVTVTDDDVATSYIHSCSPVSGIMSQYLTHAKLAVRFGSVLFLHGALPSLVPSNSNDHQNLVFPTPWIYSKDDGNKAGCVSLNDWISAVNNFASSQVRSWRDYLEISSHNPSDGVWATEGGYFNSTIGGKMFGALLQYGMGTLPDRTKTQSCVYNSWFLEGLPRDDLFESDDWKTLFELLTREGIQLIVSGHQPVGDAPWPIQIPAPDGGDTKLWLLPCDTSFSGDTQWTSLEGFDSSGSVSLGRGSVASKGRGDVAFSEPLIQLCPIDGVVNSARIHGCLSNGSYYETGNIIDMEDKDNLGKKLGHAKFKDNDTSVIKEGMFWVKGKLLRSGSHLVSYGEGFNVWNSYIKSL